LFFQDTKFLVILPGRDAAHDMDIPYKLNPQKYDPVAGIASNFCHWIMNGDDDDGNSIYCEYLELEQPGWMYTLAEGSDLGTGIISCADVFAIHGWWLVSHLKTSRFGSKIVPPSWTFHLRRNDPLC
jgi:hypothetical protein